MGEKHCVKSHVFMCWGKMMLTPHPLNCKLELVGQKCHFKEKFILILLKVLSKVFSHLINHVCLEYGGYKLEELELDWA